MLRRAHLLGRNYSHCIARRALSSRASAVLEAVNIPTTGELPGVYDGSWKGSGEIFESKCPSTGEVLAHVRSVRSLPKFLAPYD